jgi:phage-related protein
MKTLRFVGGSLESLKQFPVEARRAAGYELDAVQRDLMPADFKVMATIGPGVYEIRIHVRGEWRLIYVARRQEAVYVLHAFQKKSRATPRGHIELARQRYKALEHIS